MALDPRNPDQWVTANVRLSLPSRDIEARVTLPAGPTTLLSILPVIQSLTDAIVAAAVTACEKNNRTVSCHKGCCTCCRVLASVAEAEAWNLRNLVEDLPPGRRQAVRDNFARAREKLAAGGLLDQLLDRAAQTQDELKALSSRYWTLGISCPFLEEGACSIYPDRPVRCREVIVVSPPANCNPLNGDDVERVELAGEVAAAMYQFAQGPSAPPRWVPLILALEWADAHEDLSPPRPGPDLLREILERLAGREPVR